MAAEEEIAEPVDENVEVSQDPPKDISTIEVQDGQLLKLQGNKQTTSVFNYWRSKLDSALLISVTDEILNMEPVQDKLELLQ